MLFRFGTALDLYSYLKHLLLLKALLISPVVRQLMDAAH
jgi:hypothetical protein